jgi:hypothetical protein
MSKQTNNHVKKRSSQEQVAGEESHQVRTLVEQKAMRSDQPSLKLVRIGLAAAAGHPRACFACAAGDRHVIIVVEFVIIVAVRGVA